MFIVVIVLGFSIPYKNASQRLKVIYCHGWMSVINNYFKCHLFLNYWLDFDQTWKGLWPSSTIVQMVPVHCISRPHRLKIDFEMKAKQFFLSETTMPKALIFSM